MPSSGSAGLQARDRLLLATTNPGKIREIKGILAGVPVEIVTLDDFPAVPEPDETGETFEANARLKALYYSDRFGVAAVADDSGIVIDALDGAPGVHSARWHGTHYPTKFAAIYRELADRGLTTSPARFVAHIAVAHAGSIVFEATGTIEGQISPEPRGEHGFGYDPIFWYPPYGCTLAEVDGERKAAVSHRGQAFRKLRSWIMGAAR
jgi:XTP/dITP diphosphohydrolase